MWPIILYWHPNDSDTVRYQCVRGECLFSICVDHYYNCVCVCVCVCVCATVLTIYSHFLAGGVTSLECKSRCGRLLFSISPDPGLFTRGIERRRCAECSVAGCVYPMWVQMSQRQYLPSHSPELCQILLWHTSWNVPWSDFHETRGITLEPHVIIGSRLSVGSANLTQNIFRLTSFSSKFPLPHLWRFTFGIWMPRNGTICFWKIHYIDLLPKSVSAVNHHVSPHYYSIK